MFKISAISLVLRTRVITDIFNTWDEIWNIFGIHLQKANDLHILRKALRLIIILLNVEAMIQNVYQLVFIWCKEHCAEVMNVKY